MRTGEERVSKSTSEGELMCDIQSESSRGVESADGVGLNGREDELVVFVGGEFGGAEDGSEEGEEVVSAGGRGQGREGGVSS